jgi:hypothetical protein
MGLICEAGAESGKNYAAARPAARFAPSITIW